MRGDTGYAYLPAGQAEVEFAKYERRIKQLEQQCATLAAQVDRMQLVIDAAGDNQENDYKYRARVKRAMMIYNTQMARLTKDGVQ